VQGIAFLSVTHGLFAALARRYGREFTINFPLFGQAVVISDPILVKDVFSTSSDLIERPTGAGHLGEAFGPGSTFSLAGDELLARRKLVVRRFTGSGRSYEHIIEGGDARDRKLAEGRQFKTLQPMMRMTLNVILRRVRRRGTLDEFRPLPPPGRDGRAIAVLCRKCGLIWVRGVRGDFCGTGAGSTLSSTRSSPMRGPTRPSEERNDVLAAGRPATTTVSRSRSASSTSC
jgi:hypothetical protein